VYLDVKRGADARARGTERALQTVRQIAQRLLVAPDLAGIKAELESSSGRDALRDAKSRLQERVQAERAGRLFYADVEETGPAHARRFSVEARLEASAGRVRTLAAAEGSSKKEAQQAAASLALERWRGDKPSLKDRVGEGQVEQKNAPSSSARRSTRQSGSRNGKG
jgi:dsRNA-specific ribonuclease